MALEARELRSIRRTELYLRRIQFWLLTVVPAAAYWNST